MGFGLAALLAAAVLGALRFALSAPPAVESFAAGEASPAACPGGLKPTLPSAAPLPRSMRVRVLDPAGKPLPDADVHADIGTKEVKDFKLSHTYTTDAAGMVDVELPKTYYALGTEFQIAGGDPPRTVTLKPEHRIAGRVTDAATGQPVPAFTVIPMDVF